MKAQPCFSGALAGMQKEYKDYARVAHLSAILDELVVHVEAVHLQDSLQALAKLPEAERLAIIDKKIEQVKKEEEEAKALAEKEAYLAEQEAKGTGIDRPGTETNAIVLPTTSGGSSFYFYNPQTVAQGKTQFQRKWGRRPLEDNWRRRKKELSTFDLDSGNEPDETGNEPENVGDEPENAAADTLSAGTADDPHTREYYLQQLPFTQEDVDASNVIIIDGLYNEAMIYKDKLEDMPLAIEAFETLERRFPDNEHRLESYYQLYLMALRTGNAVLAAEYQNKLMRTFPESDYAVAVADPNYAENIRKMDVVQDSIYESTYDLYLAGDTSAVRRSYAYVSEKYPLATLMPKFMFLDALTYVQAGDAEGFKLALKALIDKYPAADVTELAGEMLKGVLRGRALVQGGVRGMTWNLRFGVGDDGSLSAEDSARVFTAERNTPYQMLLVYPTGSVDQNQLLFAVAAYNFANFMVKEFDLAFEQAGSISMLAIKGFISFDEITQYYKMIYGKEGYAAALNKAVAVLPISDDNYETLTHGKTLDEYIAFFDEHFGEELPDLAARWKARLEHAEEEKPEPEIPEVATDTVSVEPAPVVEPVLPEPVLADTIAMPKEETLPVLSPDTARAVLPDTMSVAVPDTLAKPVERPDTVAVPVENQGMTLQQIREIRAREAAEEEARKQAAREAFEAQQKADQALRERKAKEQADELKRQAEEERALLKAKADREKQLEADRKARLKQAEADRKAKLKAREQLRKEKERAYKERLKQKEKERKAKERAYKQKLKEREKARREALRAKERAARERRAR